MSYPLPAFLSFLIAASVVAAEAPAKTPPIPVSPANPGAATVAVAAAPLTPAEKKIQDLFVRLARARWPRHVQLLDCQSIVPPDGMEKIRSTIETDVAIPVWCSRGDKKVRLTPAGLEGPGTTCDSNTVAIVAVVNGGAGHDSLIVCPDSRWAVVNAAALGQDEPVGTLPARLMRQILRAFSFALGAGFANDPQDVMMPVARPEDLDKAGHNFGPVTIKRIETTVLQLGLDYGITASYRRLMREGVVPPRRTALWPKWEQRHGRKPAEVLKELGVNEEDYLRNPQPKEAVE